LAERLARLNGLQLRIDDGWSEVDVGSCEGKTFAELERERPELATRLARGDRDIDWPDGEAALAFEARVLGAFAKVGTMAESCVVVVSHAGPIATVLAANAPAVLAHRQLAPGDIIQARQISARWEFKRLVEPP
jgi:broad specificity phosphatase PhoE